MEWADDLGLNTYQFRVLFAVRARESLKDDFPSVADLAEYTMMDTKTTRKALHHLKRKGYIKPTERNGYSTVYQCSV